MKTLLCFVIILTACFVSSAYAGCIAGDCRNGMGTYVWDSGNRYDGQWKDGRRIGTGTFVFANGDRYTGDFQDGKFNGRGKYVYKNGDVYDGGWKNGCKEGRGVYTHADGSREEGEFKDGMIVQQWRMDVEELHEPASKSVKQRDENEKGVSVEPSRRDHDIIKPPGER